MNLDSLDEKQRYAATRGDGVYFTIAGPGSGKTRCLTYRIANLIGQGVSPSKILAITFTKNAAEEMCNRVVSLTGIDYESLSRYISTIHSFGYKVIHSAKHKLGFRLAAKPIDIYGCRKIIQGIESDRKINVLEYKYAQIRGFISTCKKQDISAGEALSKTGKATLAACYAAYEKQKQAAGYLDFDDLVFIAWRLLRDHEDVRREWQGRFRYVLVDESHDCNQLDINIATTLAEPENNLFCVFDTNQAIYGWRGSDYKLIQDLCKRYPKSEQIILAKNYRSYSPVVQLYREVITGCPSLMPEFLESITWHRDEDFAPEPTFKGFLTEPEEARWIAAQCLDHRAHEEKDIAVLVRTNAQTAMIEQAFFTARLPYVIYGASSFFSRQEVKLVLAFLRLVENTADDDALRSIILSKAECSKYLGKAFIKNLEDSGYGGTSLFDRLGTVDCEKRWMTRRAEELQFFLLGLIRRCKKLESVAEQVQAIVKETELVSTLTDEEDLEDVDNLVAENVSKLVETAKQFATRKELLDKALVLSQRPESKKAGESPVKVMTVHKAKGMEFQVVFISGADDGVLPHRRGEPDEEQRIAYVAVSRAKDRLYVCSHDQPSQFFARYFEQSARSGSVPVADARDEDAQQPDKHQHQHDGNDGVLDSGIDRQEGLDQVKHQPDDNQHHQDLKKRHSMFLPIH